MKKAQAWQDMVTSLSGANPYRSTRPGEQFALPDGDLDEQPSQPSIAFRLYSRLSKFLNHLPVKPAETLTPFADQPEYRYRKG